MIFHWIIADAACALGFFVQFSLPVDPYPDVEATIFMQKIYHLNIPMFIFGTAVLLVAYFLVWKLWLVEDWTFFKGKSGGWIFAGIMVEAVNLVGIFLLYYAAMVLSLSWGVFGEGYQWVDYCIIPILVIVILLPLWFFRKRKEQ